MKNTIKNKKEFDPGFMDADAILRGLKDINEREFKSGKIDKITYERRAKMTQKGLDAPE